MHGGVECSHFLHLLMIVCISNPPWKSWLKSKLSAQYAWSSKKRHIPKGMFQSKTHLEHSQLQGDCTSSIHNNIESQIHIFNFEIH